MFKKQNNNNETQSKKEIETSIGESIKVKGDFTGKGSMAIDGYVEGNIKSNDIVFVGEKAHVIGGIEAVEAQVSGEVMGNIKVKGHIELQSTAKITGDIKCGSISIEQGVIFNGKCTMENQINQSLEYKVQS